MSDYTDKAAAGGMINLFLMNEFRDLRKGMESRDEVLRNSIDSVREGLTVVAAKVDRSQGDVDIMRQSMAELKADVHAVRTDVDTVMAEREIEGVIQNTAWAGPRRVIKWVTVIGAAAAGLWAILKFWPAVLILVDVV